MTTKKTRNKKLAPGKLKEVLYKTLVRNPKKRMNAKQLLVKQKLGNTYASAADALKTLHEEDLIIHVKDGRYQVNKKKIASHNEKVKEHKNSQGKSQGNPKGSKGLYLGIVDQTKSGAGYIICEDLENDIFVPGKWMKGAFHGDTVEVSLNPKSRKGKPDGRVTKILKRGTKKVIGKLTIYSKYAVIHNDQGKYPGDVYISLKSLNGATEGQNVVAEITEWGSSQNKGIWGEVSKILADNSPSDIAMQEILLINGFEIDFPEEVLAESDAIPLELPEDEIANRRDFRDTLTVTIDPETARDFDDAISLNVREDGDIEVGVHIADVTHYVREGTALDRNAFERSTSVYLVDRVCPMLPEKLSNNLCSLMPNVDRFCFSALFTFNKDYKVIKRWFGKGIMHSDKRFSYEEAQERLETGKGEFAEELQLLNKIAGKLRKEKFKNGAIAFESDEVKFQLDDDGTPIGIYVKSRKEAHMLVEDFMLLANREVAHYIAKRKPEIPNVYRTHDEPNEERLADFALFAKELGVKMKFDTPSQIAASFNDLAKKARKDESLKILEPLAIRTMAKAEYTTENIGHYGLSFDHYTHFTSPIRRYADVLVHRILQENLGKEVRRDKGKLEQECKHISMQERKASISERESIKYKQAEYLLDKVGDEFEARVSGMIDRGIFLQLTESRAESMVSFVSLGDYFVIDEHGMRAKSSKTGKVFKMGDVVKVQLVSVDIESSRFELKILD